MAALCNVFLLRLGGNVKDELVSYNLPVTLDELIQLASFAESKPDLTSAASASRSAARQQATPAPNATSVTTADPAH